jgi:hypothetical protein
MEKDEVSIQHVAESNTWNYFGRNFSIPEYNTISCDCEHSGNEGHFADASKVFEFLGLSLEKLSQIFVEKPWGYYLAPAENRSPQKVAPTYKDLQKCMALATEGWSELAKLAKKTINFIHCHGEPAGTHIATYYPDGRIEIIK